MQKHINEDVEFMGSYYVYVRMYVVEPSSIYNVSNRKLITNRSINNRQTNL